MIDADLIREFVAVYGQEAYERLANRLTDEKQLEEALRRALQGPNQS
jgi:hypothetical protein